MSRRLTTVLLLAILAFVVYLGGGPFIAVYNINQGVIENDLVLIAEYVDFPVLRKNVHQQIDTSMKSIVGPKPDFFGSLFLAMEDGVVDGLISPAGFASKDSRPTKPFRHYRFEIKNDSQVIFFEKQADGSELPFIFTRDKLSWKLTNIDLTSQLNAAMKPFKQMLPKSQPQAQLSAQAPQPVTKPIPKLAPSKPKQDDVATLQNLLEELRKQYPQRPPQDTAPVESISNMVPPPISDHATMTELDAIRHHFEGCWRIDPGMGGIENLSVGIRVFVGPDGSVQRAELLDMTRYFADSKFRTVADNVRITVLGCSGVPITADHYEELKSMVLNFSAQGRIN